MIIIYCIFLLQSGPHRTPTYILLNMPYNKEDEGALYIKLMNGKIYIIHSTNNGQSIFIRDIKTGESLYEGKLKVKNTREGQNDYPINVNEIGPVQ